MAGITAPSPDDRLFARGSARGGLALLGALDRRALPALTVLMAGFAVVFTAMALARLDTFRQGFDLVSYLQPIWNTSQGRPFEQSVYAGTSTILGVDLFLIEGLLALPYALLPSYLTLFGILAVVTALGGLAVYLVAEEALGSRLAALLAGCLYLFNLTIQSVTPYEFRPRLIAATALLFAFWLQRQGRAGLFWFTIAIAGALSVRLDVALVVAMLGLYGVIQRKPWPLGLAPLVVGAAYWLVGLLVIVPALRQGGSFLFLFYFAWLGDSPGAILTTLLTRPGYVLAGVLTAEKLRYTLLLLWPVAGLALLRPAVLLPALPSWAINMLGGERTLLRIDYDYAVLIVPWVVLAAVLACGDLAHGRGWAGRVVARLMGRGGKGGGGEAGEAGKRGGGDERAGDGPLPHPNPLPQRGRGDRPWWGRVAALITRRPAPSPALRERAGGEGRFPASPLPPINARARLVAIALAAVLLGATLSQQAAAAVASGVVGARSPLVEYARGYPANPRAAAARQVIDALPRGGAVAVTSLLGPHVPMRRQLYFFPGNRAYSPALIDGAGWVIGDRRHNGNAERVPINDLLVSGRWRTVMDVEDYVLLERIR